MIIIPDLFEIKKSIFIPSTYLNRQVEYDVFLPKTKQFYPLKTLYINDGQDTGSLDLLNTLNLFFKNKQLDLVIIAIYTNKNRLQEYGTAHKPDYDNRGAKATEYMNFVIKELMPSTQKTFGLSLSAKDNYFCGFSLGGLSAFDIVWENPHQFSRVGVFSGSFWWREKSYELGFKEDSHRIMHNKVLESNKKDGLKFWLQCGTNDETEDRNNNGIIDSIDDTLDLIKILKLKDYANNDICYYEIEGGEHNFKTWSGAFPVFLNWIYTI